MRRRGHSSYLVLAPVPLPLPSQPHSTALPSPERYDNRYEAEDPGRSSQNAQNANFALTEFSEVRLKGVLGTSPRIHREFIATCLNTGSKMLRISQRFE